ncbi:helix-turn-helix domain-containing protein [Streptodolium elevatio]
MSRPPAADDAANNRSPSAAPGAGPSKRHTLRRGARRPVVRVGPHLQGTRVPDPDTWRTVLRDAIVALDATPIGATARYDRADDGRPGYTGWVYLLELGRTTISDVGSDPMRVARTARLIDRNPIDLHHLSIGQRASWAAQGGRLARLNPGDALLFDSSRPWAFTADGFVHQLVVGVPRKDLERSVGSLGQAALGRPIRAENPTLRVLTTVIGELARNTSAQNGDVLLELGHTVAELLASTLRFESAGRQDLADPRLSRSAQLPRMLDFVRRNLGDPDLSPRAVAEAFDVSLRYVELVFREGGRSPARFIRESRLDEARRMLADPRQRHRPIAAIGRSVGIESPSAFARAFRSRYATTPREYRHTRDLPTPPEEPCD